MGGVPAAMALPGSLPWLLLSPVWILVILRSGPIKLGMCLQDVALDWQLPGSKGLGAWAVGGPGKAQGVLGWMTLQLTPPVMAF